MTNVLPLKKLAPRYTIGHNSRMPVTYAIAFDLDTYSLKFKQAIFEN